MSAKKRRRNKHSARPKIGGQWVPHQVGMIHLLRRLSLTARRILDTLEIEHCRHGGRDNGRLICTYDDFERGGAGRSSISRALRDLEDAGIVDIRRGRRAYADMRVPSEYTLTFEPTYLDGKPIEPTHDWKKQNTRPDSTTGTRPESTTGNGQIPGRIPPLRRGESQAGIHHCYLDSLGDGGGGEVADDTSVPLPSTRLLSEGAEPSASSPPTLQPDTDRTELLVTAPSSGRLH